MQAWMWRLTDQHAVFYTNDRSMLKAILAYAKFPHKDAATAATYERKGGRACGWQFTFPLSLWNGVVRHLGRSSLTFLDQEKGGAGALPLPVAPPVASISTPKSGQHRVTAPAPAVTPPNRPTAVQKAKRSSHAPLKAPSAPASDARIATEAQPPAILTPPQKVEMQAEKVQAPADGKKPRTTRTTPPVDKAGPVAKAELPAKAEPATKAPRSERPAKTKDEAAGDKAPPTASATGKTRKPRVSAAPSTEAPKIATQRSTAKETVIPEHLVVQAAETIAKDARKRRESEAVVQSRSKAKSETRTPAAASSTPAPRETKGRSAAVAKASTGTPTASTDLPPTKIAARPASSRPIAARPIKAASATAASPARASAAIKPTAARPSTLKKG